MNGFYAYPSRPIVGLVVLLVSFFYSTSSYSQSIEALATCASVTENETYFVQFTGLQDGTDYSITADGAGFVLDGDLIGPFTYNNGLQTLDIVVIADPDGTPDTTELMVHEALCIDADGDGDLDYNEATCDYRASGPDYGTIVSTVAPYNGENVYLYFLTDSTGVLQESFTTSNTGHFTGLANGEYRVSAFTFLTVAEANEFRDARSEGDDLDNFTGGSDPVCFNFCGDATYTVDCGDLISITTDPSNVEICEGGDDEFSGLATVTIEEPLAALPTPNDTSYQWLVDDGSGSGFVALTGETDTLLSLTDIGFDMDGNEYRLVASVSVNGSVVDSDTSEVATLTVFEGITMSTDLDATVCSDEEAGITLALDGTSTVEAESYEIISITNDGELTAGASNASTGVFSDGSAIASDTWTNTSESSETIVYEVAATTADGCVSDTIDVVLTITPEPEFSGTLDETVCSDEIAGITLPSSGNVVIDSFEIEAVVGTGLTGTATEGGFATTDAIFNDMFTNISGATDSVVYTVTPYSGDCEGAEFDIVLTVNPVPNVEDIEDVVCSDEIIDVLLASTDSSGMAIDSFAVAIVSTGSNLTAVNQTTGNGFTDVSVIQNDEYTNTSDGTDTVVYAITPYVGGCEGEDYMVTIAVTNEPTGVDTTIFAASDEMLSINLDDLFTNGSTYRWFATPNDSVSGETIDTTNTGNVINDVITNTSGASEAVIYTVLASSDQGCVSDTILVTVNICSEPVYLDSSDPIVLCSGESLDIDLSDNLDEGSNAADGFLYTVASSNEAAVPAGAARTDTSAANITDSYTNTSNAAVTITYTITPHTDAGCVGDAFTVTVTIDPEPVLSENLDDTVCSGSEIGLILSAAETSAAIDSFEVVSVNSRGLGVTSSTSPGTIDANALSADVYTNQGEDSDSVTYSIVPISADGCRGDTVDVVITVDPEVTVDAGEDETICSTAEVDITTATISGAGVTTGTWRANGDGTFQNASGTTDSLFSGATTYVPGTNDRAGGEVILTLISGMPEGLCGEGSDSITITINSVECGTFPWTGNE